MLLNWSLTIYLNHYQIAENKDESEEGPDKKITRLAIGLEGGLQPDANKKKYNYEDSYSIVVFPSKESITYPHEGLPAVVISSVQSIIEADSVFKKMDKEQMSGTWDGEMRKVSNFSLDLHQLEN